MWDTLVDSVNLTNTYLVVPSFNAIFSQSLRIMLGIDVLISKEVYNITSKILSDHKTI